MKKQFNIWLFVAVVVLLPMSVFALVKWFEKDYTQLPVMGGADQRIQNFSLTDQEGRHVTIADWNNKFIVADFFFTHCPVVCPKMTRSLKKVQQLYADEKDLLIASFSVDPENDSVAQLKKYATRMDIRNNWQLLTGDKQQIYKLARNSFKVVATDGDGGPGDFIHSELLVLIDKSKQVRGYYNGTDEAEVTRLLQDIKRLQKEYK
jgi:protein SCO1/2